MKNINYLSFIILISSIVYSVILAVSIPKLDLMISLVGSLASGVVALIFPPLIQIVTFLPDNQVTRWMVFKNIVIMIIGFIGFLTGSVTTVISIVKSFRDGTGD